MPLTALAASLILATTGGAPKSAAKAEPARQAAPAKAPALVQPPAQPKGYAAPPPRPALARMEMQAQYQGPLQDTVIQRWRDPVDGTICYLYLPAVVAHSEVTATGYVQYGPNGIGSISCFAGPAPPAK